jgi:hypothetical protein
VSRKAFFEGFSSHTIEEHSRSFEISIAITSTAACAWRLGARCSNDGGGGGCDGVTVVVVVVVVVEVMVVVMLGTGGFGPSIVRAWRVAITAAQV